MISQVSTHYCYPLTSGPSWWCPTRVCTLQWYNNTNQPLSGPSTWLRLCLCLPDPSKHSLTFAAMQQSSVEKVQLVEWMVVGLTRVNSSTKELVIIIIIIITVMRWWLLIRRLSMMHIKEKPFNTFIGSMYLFDTLLCLTILRTMHFIHVVFIPPHVKLLFLPDTACDTWHQYTYWWRILETTKKLQCSLINLLLLQFSFAQNTGFNVAPPIIIIILLLLSPFRKKIIPFFKEPNWIGIKIRRSHQNENKTHKQNSPLKRSVLWEIIRSNNKTIPLDILFNIKSISSIQIESEFSAVQEPGWYCRQSILPGLLLHRFMCTSSGDKVI